MQTLLLLAGGAVALYCLWQFRRWLGESQESGPAGVQRLETLVDELVATAEATSTVVQEKAEALAGLIAEADRRIGALPAGEAATAAVPAGRSEAPGPTVEAHPEPAVSPDAGVRATDVAVGAVLRGAPGPSQTPVQPVVEPSGPRSPDLHRQVYDLADAGSDLTAIARGTGLSKGEVQLILGLRK